MAPQCAKFMSIHFVKCMVTWIVGGQKLYYYLFLITCNALPEQYDILLFEQNNATLSM